MRFLRLGILFPVTMSPKDPWPVEFLYGNDYGDTVGHTVSTAEL